MKVVTVVLAAMLPLAMFGSTTGVLSGDGKVLTVDVSGSDAFDPSLLSANLSTVTDFVKTGDGALTVSSDISAYKGRISVSNGTYVAEIPAALGDSSSGTAKAFEISDGATLELHATDGSNPFTVTKKTFIIGGTGVDDTGCVVHSGLGQFSRGSLGTNIVLRSDALVSVKDNFHVYWNQSKTYIRPNGHVLTLMPYSGRKFILGYPQVVDAQGGGIVIGNDTLTIMNADASFDEDGVVVITDNAAFELSGMYGLLDSAVKMMANSKLRAYTYITDLGPNTDVNALCGPVGLCGRVLPVTMGYNKEVCAVSFKGKVSDGGFSITKDSRVTDAQFHLFNPENDFMDGVTAAAGIDVYLWANGALPADGGALSLADGCAYLKSTDYYNLPSASLGGSSSVVGGVGKWAGTVEKTGEGTMAYNSSVDGAALSLKGGTVRFNAANRSKIAGLYEGSYAYKKGTSPDYVNFFKGTVFPTNSIASCTACSYDSNYRLWSIPDVAGGDTRYAIVYKGYIWNNSDRDVTWAFAGSEAAESKLAINGTTVYDQTYNTGGKKWIGHGMATLKPGANSFFYGVYAGGLTGAPNSWFTDETPAAQGKWKADFGLSVNKSGADTLLVADYEPLVDPGDGSLYTYALPGDKDIVRPGVDVPPSDLNGTLPSFDAMAFAAGTSIDFDGATGYTMSALSGFPTIANCATLTVTDGWALDASEMASDGSVRLATAGAFELADGVTVSLTNAKQFRKAAVNHRYAIATAAGGITLGDVTVVSDKEGAEYALSLSDDGKTLYLDSKPTGLMLIFR